MTHILEDLIRVTLFVLILLIWLWMLDQPFSSTVNLSVIVGGIALAFPIVWFGRRMLDKNPSMSRVVRITTVVHYTVVLVCGVSIFRAVVTHQEWSGWILPVPSEIGLILVIITGAASLLAVANLALKGLGAPFAIALSKRLVKDWLYAWTRNPMVFAVLAFFVSLGIWYQSTLFLLWVLLLVGPALLFVVKIFEERELELRFGAPYREYKARTPLLFPRSPRG